MKKEITAERPLPCRRCWRCSFKKARVCWVPINLSRQLFQLAHRRPEAKTSSTSDSLRLMMGIALGGIGVISLRVPFTLSRSFLHVLDLPSILLATFIVAVFGLIGRFLPLFLSILSHLLQHISPTPLRHLFARFSPNLHFGSISHVLARLRKVIQMNTTTMVEPTPVHVYSTAKIHKSMAPH